MYNDLIRNKTLYSLNIPNTIVPSPTEDDYLIGYIERYFTQKVNDSNGFVFEINLDNYEKLSKNPYWKLVILKWRISGPINSVINDKGDVIDIGVIASNNSSILLAQSTIRNIGLYLPNLLQFHK